MIVHSISPTETNPLSGLPASEPTGIDPDAFATTSAAIGATSNTIAVTSSGTAQLANAVDGDQLGQRVFVNVNNFSCRGPADAIACTGTTATALTTCTSTTAQTVNPGDMIEQVRASRAPRAASWPGPTTRAVPGALVITIDSTPGGSSGFANSLTTTTYNTDAPNRAYIDGTAVFWPRRTRTHDQVEDFTTGATGSSSLSYPSKALLTGDPIIPATAYNTEAGDGMTSGLVAPDGIVGVLPSIRGHRRLDHRHVHGERAQVLRSGRRQCRRHLQLHDRRTIPANPGPYVSQAVPSSGSFTLEMGATAASGGATTIVPVTCTGVNPTSTSSTFTGCTVPSEDNGFTYASSSYVGAPGAATVPQATLG